MCRWVCEEVGMWGGGWIYYCSVWSVVSIPQSSRPGPSVTAGPHSIPHYKQGKVTCLIISTH